MQKKSYCAINIIVVTIKSGYDMTHDTNAVNLREEILSLIDARNRENIRLETAYINIKKERGITGHDIEPDRNIDQVLTLLDQANTFKSLYDFDQARALLNQASGLLPSVHSDNMAAILRSSLSFHEQNIFFTEHEQNFRQENPTLYLPQPDSISLDSETDVYWQDRLPDVETIALSAIPDTLYRTRVHGNIGGKTIADFYKSDAINCNESNRIISYNIITDPISDAYPKTYGNMAHRDGIQLSHLPIWNAYDQCDRFSAGVMDRVLIHKNNISSTGMLQGIFSSDGLFTNLTITSNTVNTASDHQISINGMVSGTLRDNTDENGKLLNITLKPLRLGGNAGTGNIWIHGIREPNLKYLQINKGNPVADLRTTVPDGIGYKNFPVSLFHQHYNDPATTIRFFLTKDPALDQQVRVWISHQATYKQTLSYYEGNYDTPLKELTNTNLRCFFIHELAAYMAREDTNIVMETA